ncbi:MAG: lipoyl synthase [Clostridiales bacterium]|nr:lipoyl synthase [Clostridiales bacterium]
MIRKPEWLKVKIASGDRSKKVRGILKKYHLNTVCDEALCPNRGECFDSLTATFMILGKNCTRNCTFCNVTKGIPETVDNEEPANVALATQALGLKYVVITSVTRDDLPDYGSNQFVKVIREIRKICPNTKIEVLIPDFKGDMNALQNVINEKPDVISHNVETIPSLYNTVRPMADYKQSIQVLSNIKTLSQGIYSKSGIMVGLGETPNEVLAVFDDLRQVGCDFLTIGQYLAPSKAHIAVKEYITPEQFLWYKEKAYDALFAYVASSPLVRSSYMAHEAINHIRRKS